MARIVSRSLLFVCLFAWAAGAHADSRQVKKLLRDLKGRKAEIAASKLADLGKDALEGLTAALKNKSWKVRYWAAYALAYSKAAKEGGAVDSLKPLLEEKNPLVALRAAMALGKLGDKSGVALAKEHVKSSNAEHRAEAMAALGASGDAEMVPHLKEALKDDHPKVRYWALLGMRDLAAKEAQEHAMKAISDASSEVRLAAIEVLGAGGPGNEEAEEALIKALASGEGKIRQYAASALADVGGKKALAALRKLRDKDPASFVRDTADAAVVKIAQRLKSGG